MLAAIKGEIDSNKIIVGDFNNPPIPMDRSYRKKINKETQSLNDTLDHKSSLGKVKKIEIISSIFSTNNVMRLEINYR